MCPCLCLIAEQDLLWSQDTAYSPWSDSDLKSWLVSHGIIKSNAQLEREKLQKLVIQRLFELEKLNIAGTGEYYHS